MQETISKYRDPSYWASLCPGLTITEDEPLAKVLRRRESPTVPADAWRECKETIRQDGYFACESYFSPELVDRLADALRCLDAADVHPVFCFVYDEFWEILLQISPLLTDLIGAHQWLPAVWAWIVRTDNQTAFSPHRDQTRVTSLDNENHLDYLTLWIPLTDLDHRSSSIFLLPASLDPNYDQGTSRTDVENLQDIRSLQVPKGSVLAWAVGLVHWGSRQTRFGEPRLSVGYYVQKSTAECLVPPPFDFEKDLSLTQRLNVIGQQILDYSRDRDMKLINMAKTLVELD